MNTGAFSKVEKCFFDRSGRKEWTTRMPYVVVKNFPELGLLTSLRFLEWVSSNPDGVVSLPTGKTPEYFINWTKRLLADWNSTDNQKIMRDNGLELPKKPSLSGLHFVQIDEFYPIDPFQHNSFFDYVIRYYIQGFGLDSKKSLLINSENITLAEGQHYSTVFPGGVIDLSLRNREPRNAIEELQQASIFRI
ncbi:MAG TPA: hypothetical protein VK155_02830, partial [Bacteroidales bacterium]|nr:hypothetical protein [Bacteroidales bacterium]